MKKRALLPLALIFALLAALLLFLLRYLWPRGFWDALPGYQPGEEITSCYAILTPRDPTGGPPAQVVEFPPGSPEYAELMDLAESSGYRRDLLDLLRLGRASDSQPITLSPCAVSLCFRQGESQCSMDFWGPRVVANSSAGASRTYHPTGGTSFQQQVADLVSLRLQDQSA